MPISRLRGAKRYGLTFEKAFGKALTKRWPKQVLSGQWFQFGDVNGSGYCQPDLLLVFSNEVVIFECKLTDTEQGRSQLAKLYYPVVEKALGRAVKGVVVVRHLTQETQMKNVVDDIGLAMLHPAEIIPTLHWRERNPL